MVTEGIEPSTVALLAQRSNQLSYATFLNNSCLSSTYCSAEQNPLIQKLSIDQDTLTPPLFFIIYHLTD